MLTSPRARIRSALLLATVLLAASRLAPPTRAASGIDGLWDASVVANGVEIPFRFEIATNGSRGAGIFLRGRPQGRLDVRTLCRWRGDARVRLPEHDLRSHARRRPAARHLQEQPAQRASAGHSRAPVRAGAARRGRSAGARRQLGDAAERGGGQRAARHAHVAPDPAAVGRRGLGRHPAHRRRHRHARRPLAERTSWR